MVSEDIKLGLAARALALRWDHKHRRWEILRSRWTIESNSVLQQNLIGNLIANLKPKLREERASQIHILPGNRISYRIFVLRFSSGFQLDIQLVFASEGN